MHSLPGLFARYESNKTNEVFVSNEAQISRSLVAPFFRDALHWDIDDPDQVKFEENIKGKRADIVFCLESISQFIVEVKNLKVDILDNVSAYAQAIQYAYAKGKKFAILTNFRDFVILRADVIPPSNNWLLTELSRININEVEKDLGDLRYFDKSIWKNEIARLSELDARLPFARRKTIDDDLLSLFMAWRTLCLTWLKKNEAALFNKYDIDFIEEEVQRFLDRIIFICFCEDKELEDIELKQYISTFEGSLQLEMAHASRGIVKLFERYRNRYNSDLFKEGLADKFGFDDQIYVRILKSIKEPANQLPFDFSIIPSDILGKTYENFIGHLVRGRTSLTEVSDIGKRKQEGIYYTPQWVVNFIISRTVRVAFKGQNLKSARKIKVLDPSCGSGTFLIAAFDEIVRQVGISEARNLTYEERRDLFLSCIFGVDKDDRACDIAKLNISLRLAERAKKLPSFSGNIVCGDSLLPDDEVSSKGGSWEARFPEICGVNKPGFDVIIGNPPYLSTKDMDNEEYKTALTKHYEYLDDLYSLFIRLCDKLISPNGLWSMILPNTFFTLVNYQRIREILYNNYEAEIFDLSPNVFKDAYVYNAIAVGRRVPKKQSHIVVGYLSTESSQPDYTQKLDLAFIEKLPKKPIIIPIPSLIDKDKQFLQATIDSFAKYANVLVSDSEAARKSRILDDDNSKLTAEQITLLGVLCRGAQGLVTGNNSKYIGIKPADQSEKDEIWSEFLKKLAEHANSVDPLKKYDRKSASELYDKAEKTKERKEKPALLGKFFLYKIVEPDQVIDYAKLTPVEKEQGIKSQTPKWIYYHKGNAEGDIWAVRSNEYLDWSTKSVTELKEKKVTNSRWQGVEYYFKTGFGWVDYFTNRLKGFYVEPTVYSKNVVKFHSEHLDDRIFLALINSSYISYFVKKYITNTRTLQINDGKLIPVVIPKAEVKGKLIHNVQRIIDLKNEHFDAANDNDKARLASKIKGIEKNVDNIIFKMYGYDPDFDSAKIQTILEFLQTQTEGPTL
jgi:type I restriction-modification system DNA methylase subunit